MLSLRTEEILFSSWTSASDKDYKAAIIIRVWVLELGSLLAKLESLKENPMLNQVDMEIDQHVSERN